LNQFGSKLEGGMRRDDGKCALTVGDSLGGKGLGWVALGLAVSAE